MTAALQDIAARYASLNDAVSKGAIKPAQAAILGEQYAYPVSKDGLGIARSGAAQTSGIDATEHSVPFIISTQEEDRDGDVVVSRGGELASYSLNPVVLFGHGSWQVPIGTAKNRNGELCVWCEDNRVRAKCFFDMPDPDAAFIYGKVERGILNATSISFLPVLARRREQKAYHDDAKPLGWIFDRWELTEFSLVAIPANAGAVRDALDSEKSFISPKLQKALLPYAAQAKGCFTGYCPCPPCEEKAFNEADHPRGQPDNAGQFGPGSGLPSSESSTPTLNQHGGYGVQEASPSDLEFTEDDQNQLDSVRERFPEGEGYPPAVVLIADDGTKKIIDGHNRATVAEERGDNLPYVQITQSEFDYLEENGFERPEILYAVLESEGEADQASAILSQFGNVHNERANEAAVYLQSFREDGEDKSLNRTYLDRFLHIQKVKAMSTKLNAATLTSGLPGAKKACHKSSCACKKCKAGKTKALPEQANAASGAEAAGVHEDRNEQQEQGANELGKAVASKMPKLMECGYSEPQAGAIAHHLCAKGDMSENIDGHEEVAMALGYKKDDMSGAGGTEGGYAEDEQSMSLKSFVKAMKEDKPKETEEEDSAKPAEEEPAAEGETEEEVNGEEGEQYKHSAKVLGGLHNHMRKAHEWLQKELPIMDHEQIGKAMTAHSKDLEGHMADYKSLAETHHPDLDFDKMCKSLSGETEADENETGANSEGEATSAEDHGSTDESAQELIQEYQHPKSLDTETIKTLIATRDRIKGMVDQKANEWFQVSGQRV